jgi:hypothetical protein
MHGPARDWHEIEKLYVFGEIVKFRHDGSVVRHYPSIRELSKRLGIARSVLGNRASRGGWAAARGRFQAAEREKIWRRLADQALADGHPDGVLAAALRSDPQTLRQCGSS